MTELEILGVRDDPVDVLRKDLITHGFDPNQEDVFQAAVHFFEATKMPIPVTKSEKGRFKSDFREHVEEFGMDLQHLYRRAWLSLLPQINEGVLDIVAPGSMGFKMRSLRNIDLRVDEQKDAPSRQRMMADLEHAGLLIFDPDSGRYADANGNSITSKSALVSMWEEYNGISS